MKDDIARHPHNPLPGFIRHEGYPYNAYEGVPKVCSFLLDISLKM